MADRGSFQTTTKSKLHTFRPVTVHARNPATAACPAAGASPRAICRPLLIAGQLLPSAALCTLHSALSSILSSLLFSSVCPLFSFVCHLSSAHCPLSSLTSADTVQVPVGHSEPGAGRLAGQRASDRKHLSRPVRERSSIFTTCPCVFAAFECLSCAFSAPQCLDLCFPCAFSAFPVHSLPFSAFPCAFSAFECLATMTGLMG